METISFVTNQRSVAYASEDKEFRDNIYEKGLDAYISLGAIAYPDKMNEIFKECGYDDYDEETKEWKIKGDYGAVKELAQKPLPGLPKGLRGIGKVGLISLIYG